MKSRTQILAVLAVVFTMLAVPSFAQPGGQPYMFYSEEPWGGGSYLGVDTRDVTTDRLSALHLKEEHGVEVTMVDQDAPAGKVGLKEHDVILSINNSPVESVAQLRRMIREVPPGRTATLGISRDGQPMSVKVELGKRPQSFPSGPASGEWGMNHFPAMPAIPAVPAMPAMPAMPSEDILSACDRSGSSVERV